MKKKLVFKTLIALALVVMIVWLLLTLYVERSGPSKRWIFGANTGHQVLIVYDPDPFYNLDERVCKSFATALSTHNFQVNVATVGAAGSLIPNNYELIVYCANTYNWRPDWSITNFIKDHRDRQLDKRIIAITLGAGSTESSKKNFEKVIINSGGILLDSYSLWLWRPNDDTKPEKSNVAVAENIAYNWGNKVADELKNRNHP